MLKLYKIFYNNVPELGTGTGEVLSIGENEADAINHLPDYVRDIMVNPVAWEIPEIMGHKIIVE